MTDQEALQQIKAAGKKHYVYLLCRPDGTPFYVGVGTGRRFLDHAIFARRPQNTLHRANLIRKIWRSGHDIDYRIDAFFDDWSCAARAEAELIAQIGRRDLGLGPLVNFSDGGEGSTNPTDASLEARSQSLRKAWAKRNKTAAMSHLRDPEVVARAVASRTGAKRGSYTVTKKMVYDRDALSARVKANPPSRLPGVGAKISAALKGRTRPNDRTKTPEYRASMRGGLNWAAKAVSVRGQVYSCQREAADACGVTRDTIRLWIKAGKHQAHNLTKENP